MAAKILLSTTVTWPAAARLAGAFAACGAIVEAYAPRRHAVSESRSLSRFYPYRPLQALAGLRETLEISSPDLVMPCDDRAVRHLLTLAQQDKAFTALIGRSLGQLDRYDTLMSRAAFLIEAESFGILVPRTRPAATEAELKAALHVTGLPVVLKIDGSWGGGGVSFAHSYEKALAAFGRMALAPSRLHSLARAAKRQDAHFLLEAAEPKSYAISVQRLIEGTPATCAFACWNGEVLASLHMDVAATSEPAGPASMLRRIESPEMAQAAQRIAKAFGLSGFHGLDFMRDSLGRLYLIEINPRATQICHLALGEGRDLPAALLSALEDRPIPARASVTDAPTIALFPQTLLGGPRLAGVYHDIPADDPNLLHALSASRDMHKLGSAAASQNL